MYLGITHCTDHGLGTVAFCDKQDAFCAILAVGIQQLGHFGTHHFATSFGQFCIVFFLCTSSTTSIDFIDPFFVELDDVFECGIIVQCLANVCIDTVVDQTCFALAIKVGRMHHCDVVNQQAVGNVTAVGCEPATFAFTLQAFDESTVEQSLERVYVLPAIECRNVIDSGV